MSKKDGKHLSQDPEKRARQLANLLGAKQPKEGNVFALRHGCYSEAYMSPLVQRKEEELMELLKEVSYITGVDGIIVRNLARALARLERFDIYLDELGDVYIRGSSAKLNPVISAYFTALESARRHCEALGLTPSARARLGVDLAKYQDIAERMAKRQKK